jgi:ATP-dependent helicase/nuclease subunit B
LKSDSFTTVHWAGVLLPLRELIAKLSVHPCDVVVLVPYAQLMHEARQAWASSGEASFVPRFETTQNWASALQSAGPAAAILEPSPDDIRQDAACDWLTAASLLDRAGLNAHKELLAARVVESAWSLARLAAAVPPSVRSEWGQRHAAALSSGMEAPVLAVESAVGQLALAWAASSAYPTDVLFEASCPLLVVVEGFQPDPLGQALVALWQARGDPAQTLRFPSDSCDASPTLRLQAALDAEDEAERAAACVLARLAQGLHPVALVAQDRVLTRRVRAMLTHQGLRMRDETGWKLSTTRTAASLMSLLRAAQWDASSDAVLDWLKNSPGMPPGSVSTAEAELRRAGLRHWQGIGPSQKVAFALAEQCKPLLAPLQGAKPLVLWLRNLRQALQATGQWQALLDDVAGQALLDAMRLREGQEAEFEAFQARMSLRDFTAWVNQTLESASFTPEHPVDPQVIILPLSQLLGRVVQAVVLPGADEIRLPVSPEPPGAWSPAQRALLGLPTREALAVSARAAWQHALRCAPIDVLWRNSEAGERLLPSGFVQAVLLLPGQALADDARMQRHLLPRPTRLPAPSAQALPVTQLSATGYDDLRRCPYRFFVLRQLRLREPDELDGELEKRDFGNWLHGLLRHFHEALEASPTADQAQRRSMLDAAAERSTREMALSESEFLPFAAAWPRVREGYLIWLASHEAEGARFLAAEAEREMPLGSITLIGKIDRLDRAADGSTLVIDYKAEARDKTVERIKLPQEDTQLAFYAALLPDDELAGAYVSLGEKEPTRTYVQSDIVELRDQLIDSILADIGRIAEGAPLPALGEGSACGFCAARGLCRRDFVEAA